MVLRGEHELQPFMRDKLLVSIHESCRHRQDGLGNASALTDTIFSTALKASETPGIISLDLLKATAREVLARYDAYAAQHYEAYFMKRA